MRRLEVENKPRGGTVLPDTAKEKVQKGTVLAVGLGKLLDNGKRADFQVSVGGKIIFAGYAGANINYMY